MSRRSLATHPDGPQTRDDVLDCRQMFIYLVGRVPTKVTVPRATLEAWKAWGADNQATVCGMAVTVGDIFQME